LRQFTFITITCSPPVQLGQPVSLNLNILLVEFGDVSGERIDIGNPDDIEGAWQASTGKVPMSDLVDRQEDILG
jgi:hypothetical protein